MNPPAKTPFDLAFAWSEFALLTFAAASAQATFAFWTTLLDNRPQPLKLHAAAETTVPAWQTAPAAEQTPHSTLLH